MHTMGMGVGIEHAFTVLYLLLLYAVAIAFVAAVLYFVVKKAVIAGLREARKEAREEERAKSDL